MEYIISSPCNEKSERHENMKWAWRACWQRPEEGGLSSPQSVLTPHLSQSTAFTHNKPITKVWSLVYDGEAIFVYLVPVKRKENNNSI